MAKKVLLFFFFISMLSFGQENSKVMLKLFNMKTSNDFFIKIPETDSICKLTEFEKIDSLEYAKGSYSDEDEIGDVFLDYLQMHPIHLTGKKTVFFFVAPFIVTNQGSGIFYYLGFFTTDTKEMRITHLDSYFLGDTILIESIKITGNRIKISIKVHSEDQAMSDDPDQTKNFELKVNKKGFIKD